MKPIIKNNVYIHIEYNCNYSTNTVVLTVIFVKLFRVCYPDTMI